MHIYKGDYHMPPTYYKYQGTSTTCANLSSSFFFFLTRTMRYQNKNQTTRTGIFVDAYARKNYLFLHTQQQIIKRNAITIITRNSSCQC